jgi:hypothetical protein
MDGIKDIKVIVEQPKPEPDPPPCWPPGHCKD